MRKHTVIGILTGIGLLMSCTQRNASVGRGNNSRYCEDSAMAHFLTEPDRAMGLLDSAVMAGNLTTQRGEYLKAVVLLSAKDEADSAIGMCQRMIDEEVWETLPDSEDVTSFQVDLYRLMANSAHSVGNQMGVVRYAREGVRLAHGHDRLAGDEADMLGRMGLVLCQMGERAEGLDALRRAQALTENDNTWSSLVSYYNIAKKRYYALDMMDQRAQAKTVVRHALARLDELRDHIGQVEHAPQAMIEDSTALEEFIQFYQASFYSYLTNIYAADHQMDSAQHWLARLEKNPLASDPSITQALISPLIAMGRYEQARERIDGLKEVLQADTVSDDYVMLLQQEMKLQMMEQHQGAANEQFDRLCALNDSVRCRNTQLQIADATVQYQLQDERQRRIDTEKHLLQTIIALVLLLSLIIGGASVYYIRRLRARGRALNEELDETKKELECIREICEEEAAKSTEVSLDDIYARAVALMDEELPFRDSSFDINTLAARISTNRYYLSSAVNTLSGMNFRSWVAHYRVEYAKQVLTKNPTITNDTLATECGFDNRISLYRNFKNQEGMTPNEWIQKQNQ